MGKLYFRYGCMNSSKSANLLMIKYNYEEQNLKVLLLKPSIDTREAVVKSRIGIESDCILFDEDCDLIQLVKNQPETDVILVDEAQFCSEEQIDQLWRISVQKPVMCFGLLKDFQTKMFPGSKRLVELAESIQEIKTVCKCGRKATLNARFDQHGKMIKRGPQVVIGGNEQYRAVCKECYIQMMDEED